jgi:hypothetical protein
MDYLTSYLNLSETIRENVKAGKRPTPSGLGSRVDTTPLEVPEGEDVQQRYMSLVKSIFPEQTQREYKTEANPEVGLEELYIEDEQGNPQRRPQGRSDIVPEAVKKDPEFRKEVQRLTKKYGISELELYKVIQGESSFNPKAQNPSGATGLFQFMPATAAELGWTTEEIKEMAPAEQLKVYDQYLERWNYDGSNALGIMQGAPAFASASDDTVVYRKGSAAWKQNPGWRPSDGGDITVGSMNAYYNRKKV